MYEESYNKRWWTLGSYGKSSQAVLQSMLLQAVEQSSFLQPLWATLLSGTLVLQRQRAQSITGSAPDLLAERGACREAVAAAQPEAIL